MPYFINERVYKIKKIQSYKRQFALIYRFESRTDDISGPLERVNFEEGAPGLIVDPISFRQLSIFIFYYFVERWFII